MGCSLKSIDENFLSSFPGLEAACIGIEGGLRERIPTAPFSPG